MSDVFTEGGVLYDVTPEPPGSAWERRIAEQRESTIEWNTRMAQWMSNPPPLRGENGEPLPVAAPQVAGEGGTPRAVRWTPREVPPLPEVRSSTPPAITRSECPQCQAQDAGAGPFPDYEHLHWQRDYDIRRQYAPKAVVKMLPDPRTGTPIATLLAPDVA